MKKFRCIPTAMPMVVLFLLMCLPLIWFAFAPEIKWKGPTGEDGRLWGIVVCGIMVVLALGMALLSWTYSARRIELLKDKVVCKGLFSWHTFEIEYATCNVGFDYHLQNGRRVWWIYICYEHPPTYKAGNPANRINSVKIRPGFIKIMYSDKVYNALLEVLPKRQRTGLETAYRCAMDVAPYDAPQYGEKHG